MAATTIRIEWEGQQQPQGTIDVAKFGLDFSAALPIEMHLSSACCIFQSNGTIITLDELDGKATTD